MTLQFPGLFSHFPGSSSVGGGFNASNQWYNGWGNAYGTAGNSLYRPYQLPLNESVQRTASLNVPSFQCRMGPASLEATSSSPVTQKSFSGTADRSRHSSSELAIPSPEASPAESPADSPLGFEVDVETGNDGGQVVDVLNGSRTEGSAEASHSASGTKGERFSFVHGVSLGPERQKSRVKWCSMRRAIRYL